MYIIALFCSNKGTTYVVYTMLSITNILQTSRLKQISAVQAQLTKLDWRDNEAK